VYSGGVTGLGFFTSKQRRNVTPGRAAPDAILPPDHSWLIAGIDDEDTGPEATARRVHLLHRLVHDRSFDAAGRVLERILAAPSEGEDDGWNRLYAEYSYLRAIPRLDEERVGRLQTLGEELVRRYSDDPDQRVRGIVVLVDATLTVTDRPSFARWMQKARRRPDFDELMLDASVRDAIGLLEQMVVDDSPAAAGPDTEAVFEDATRIRELLRWWSEPGASLPARLGTAELPPAGAVDGVDDERPDAALAMAARLAAASRYGDALGIVRSVARSADTQGHDLTRAIAAVVEGQLLVLVDRVNEAAHCLGKAASDLIELRRLDVVAQVYLGIALLGVAHPDVDASLAPWIVVDGPSGPGSRLLLAIHGARSIAELLEDHDGVWRAELLHAQMLLALGRPALARTAIVGLPDPPDGPGAPTARAEAALARARILMMTDGPPAGRQALAQAERTVAATLPWLAWQLHAMRAEVELEEGRLDDARMASDHALEILARLRPGIGDERDRASWAGSRRGAWHHALRIADRRGSSEESLSIIEDAKSAHLARIVLAQAAAAPDRETADRVGEALNRLAATAVRPAALSRAALDAVHDDSEELLRIVRRRDSALAAAIAPPRLDSDALSRLGAAVGDFLLLDYLDLGEDSVWRVAAHADGTFEARMLRLDATQRATLAKLDGAPSADAVALWMWEDGARAELCTLASTLLAGVADMEGGLANLVVSPSGRLGNVPWAALEVSDGMVIDRYAVTLVPSLVLGLSLANRARGTGAPVMMCCDPLGDLDGVAQQRDRLRDLWPGLAVYEDAAAGISSLASLSEAGVLSAASRLIWAGHGMAHPYEPLASGLLLGDGSILTAGSLGALSLPADVELWTCGSSVERRLSFDEQLGLVSACVRAGASSVLASMWSLPDELVVELSGRYHEALLRGDAPAEAWRQAQLGSREDLPVSAWGAIALWGVAGAVGGRPVDVPLPDERRGLAAGVGPSQAPAVVPGNGRWAPPSPSLSRLGDDLDAVLARARDIADRTGSRCIGTGHALWSLLHDIDVGPVLAGVGLFPARVEALLMALPPLGRPEPERADVGRHSTQLEEALVTVKQGASVIVDVLALLEDPLGDAREIVRHCALEPDDLEDWISGARPREALVWRAYEPPAAALVEIDAVARYETLCTSAATNLWAWEHPSPVMRGLIAARARDLARGAGFGRIAGARARTLELADTRRGTTADGRTVTRLMELAFAHASAQAHYHGVRRDLADPQTRLAIAAARAALVLAQGRVLLAAQAQCHLLLSDLLRNDDDPRAGIAHARLACEIAHVLGSDRTLAYAEITLGHALAGEDARGNFEVFAQQYRRAAEILRRIGNEDEADALLTTIEEVRAATDE